MAIGVCGALDGAVTPSDDQDMIELVIGIDNLGKQSNIQGVCGGLDGAVSPPDDQDTAKLVKLVQIGSSGELDGAPTLPDGRDTTKTVETNLVILRRPWSHAILDLTSVPTTSLLLGLDERRIVRLGTLGSCGEVKARCKINIQGVCGALDRAVSPPDDQDSAKLVKLVQIGPSGELDGNPTLPDGRDTTKTVETNLVCTQNL
ncbi:hypothetical protein Tco_1017141 [Tanacetum coccineum]|uniref:Uncharacterized protein n=1 Tax=Tanacetum coccineum TaxID=301880 RepID=A0ABQ5FQN1_9ASTR